MQAHGDFMIGQHGRIGRSVHEAILHPYGAKALPTSLLHLSSSPETISQSIKPTVERLSYKLLLEHLIVGVELIYYYEVNANNPTDLACIPH